jgi:HEAT repeat protein
VQEALLLALPQIWMRKPDAAHPGQYLAEADSPQAQKARKLAMDTLLKFADAQESAARKAAVLGLSYFKGQEEAESAIPILMKKLETDPEVDVRMSAAVALGQLAKPGDQRVLDALGTAMRDSDPHDVELVWNAAGALAQLGSLDAKDVVLRLLDRKELDQMQSYDRETDPKNPTMRALNEPEKQRILINVILACQNYAQPEVQAAIKRLAESDPSERVKQAAMEVMKRKT